MAQRCALDVGIAGDRSALPLCERACANGYGPGCWHVAEHAADPEVRDAYLSKACAYGHAGSCRRMDELRAWKKELSRWESMRCHPYGHIRVPKAGVAFAYTVCRNDGDGGVPESTSLVSALDPVADSLRRCNVGGEDLVVAWGETGISISPGQDSRGEESACVRRAFASAALPKRGRCATILTDSSTPLPRPDPEPWPLTCP